jgi:hypothetical protein
MTTVLHIPARLDAPIACDMSTAQDTPGERFAEYARLFERALLRRERRADGVVLALGAGGGTLAAVEDLARREAACCPFLDYRIDATGDEVVWTVSNVSDGPDRAGVDVILDALHALPDHTGSGFDGYLGRLADAGVDVVEAGDDRFELGGSPTR